MTVLMRALNLSSSFITWTSNTPDYEGVNAPESIQSGSAIVVADTGGTDTGGTAPIQKLGLEYSPVGLWLFENNLNDSSGNGLNLSGIAYYTTEKDGHVCARIGSAWSMSASSPTLAITGALTIECVVRTATNPMFALFSYGSSGDAEPANICYMMRITSNRTFNMLWESGAGVDRGFDSPAQSMPEGWFAHVAVTRSATDPAVSSVYVNGIAVATGSATACTGGGSTASRFRIGADDLGGLIATASVFSSFKIIAAELTPAQVVAEYNRTLGGHGIVYQRL